MMRIPSDDSDVGVYPLVKGVDRMYTLSEIDSRRRRITNMLQKQYTLAM